MDGFTGFVKYNEELEREKQFELKRQKAKLAFNRNKVKKAFLKSLDMETLEPFAEDAIRKTATGQLVDDAKLSEELAKWKEKHNADSRL